MTVIYYIALNNIVFDGRQEWVCELEGLNSNMDLVPPYMYVILVYKCPARQ